MTVLVTGGAGYIGGHAVHELVDAGAQVVVLDNLSTGHFLCCRDRCCRLSEMLATRRSWLRLSKTMGIDALMHFAGSTIVPELVTNPLKYYRNNTVNSHALIEAAVRGGVRHFIFSSTAAVYGNPARVPVAEDSPTVPLSPYGRSKLMTETMLRDAGDAHGLCHVILRYFNVAGADADADRTFPTERHT